MSELSGPTTAVTVSLGSPAELVASLPALLGFAPTASLVAIALHGHKDRHRVGGMCRVDLPETTETAAAFAEAVVRRLAASDPAWVQLVVIAEPRHAAADPDLGLPPEAGLVEMFTATFAAGGIECPAPLWVPRIAAGASWRCYDPCGCTGTLPDPGVSTLAAHTALLGRITYRSRDEAEAALAADPAAEGARRRERLDEAHRHARCARARSRSEAVAQDLVAVRDGVARIERGETLPEPLLARVVVALGDPAVRDVCLGFALGRDPAVDAAGAAELWWQLSKAVPAPEVAEPATLLAFASLRHGGGLTLSVALERAVRADPGHRLSRLLGQIVQTGMPAATIEEMVLEAAAEAEQLFAR